MSALTGSAAIVVAGLPYDRQQRVDAGGVDMSTPDTDRPPKPALVSSATSPALP